MRFVACYTHPESGEDLWTEEMCVYREAVEHAAAPWIDDDDETKAMMRCFKVA